MAKAKKDSKELKVTFVGLGEEEKPPEFAVYKLNSAGRPTRKIGKYNGKSLKFEDADIGTIAFGPDTDDFKTLPKESLSNFRLEQNIKTWQERGVVLPRDIWKRFHFYFTCVSGTVEKCRPWFWKFIDDVQFEPMYELIQKPRIKPITSELELHRFFPHSCQPVCDGVVEIYERKCCFPYIQIPDFLERLHEILKNLPIPIPDPFPGPIPRPDPGPFPFSLRMMRKRARQIKRQKVQHDLTGVPPENLYRDYMTLRAMPSESAQKYVINRPYLFPLICESPPRKVGQTHIRPGGQFDFCYLNISRHIHHPSHWHCYTTYAYKVKQLVNGVTTVVYDGVAANEYFSGNEPADIRTYNPLALSCADGPGDPPPNDGEGFVMLEHVGSHGTYHYNYPAQTGASEVGVMDVNDGTYTTNYAPDCPWGGALGLRLWFSPELESVVKYYRLKAVEVNDAGNPLGTPHVLERSVSWDKLVNVGSDIVRAAEPLGPVSVGDANNLFKVPYWSSPDHRYLSGQYHQVWNTAQAPFDDGKYMLILEVFDKDGNQIKPTDAAGPGTEKGFQFRRWVSSSDTDPVPYSDISHIFWIDNTPVGADLVDFRQNGDENTDECQFMTGTESDKFAVGFRAYHVNGVEHAGNGDSNSFMWRYHLRWQRGLNGGTGVLGHAPVGGNNHTDVGESGLPVSSDTADFSSMLDGHSKCTFSVKLHVYAKHYTGRSRISGYDYQETASFALEAS